MHKSTDTICYEYLSEKTTAVCVFPVQVSLLCISEPAVLSLKSDPVWAAGKRLDHTLTNSLTHTLQFYQLQRVQLDKLLSK